MHQQAAVRDKIGVVILNVEIVDLDRRFQQLVLDLFNNHVLAVDEDQNIPGPKLDSARPTLHR